MQANSTYIRVLASALSSTYGVKVEEGEIWAFNSDTKTLIYNPLTLLERPVEVVRGVLLHEIGHLIYTQPVPSSQIYKDYPIINIVYNAFEDVRIEKQLERQFGDFASEPILTKNLDGIGAFFEKNALVNTTKAYQIGAITVMVDLMMQIMGGRAQWNNYDEKKLFDKIARVETNLQEYVEPDVHEAAQVIQKKEDWQKLVSWARSAPSFGDIQKLVDQKVFPHIKHLIEQDPANESMKQAMAAKQAQKQQQGKGQGQPQSGQGEPSDEEKEEQAAQAAQAGDSTEEMAGAIGAELNEPGTGTYANTRHSTRVPNYPEASAMVSPYTNFLASRIKDILKENTAINFHGNHRAGKLLSRNVTKLVLGEERVFSKRNTIDSPHHHLIVALDSSGSMSGELMQNAYLGTVMALDTFRKVRMPFAVFDFDDEVDLLVSNTQVDPRFVNYQSKGGGTSDDDMIRVVAKYMAQRPDSTFLFLVIGDGQGRKLPKPELEYIQSRGLTIGIGIGSGAHQVAKAYPNGVMVQDVTQLPQVILQKLHDYISR